MKNFRDRLKSFVHFKTVSLTLAIACTSACGPIYDTVYNFTPPPTASGKTCSNQCDNSKINCEELVELKYERCQLSAERQQELCQLRLAAKGKEEKWYECPLDSCSQDSERCEKQYHSCYQSCGGKVTAKRVCVMNCDKVGQDGAADDT